ncbi:unnamed protein product [Didymodactylos carnosus]|uniref:MATH domain-containing protein n=1 Tax=Didymodactylos carnosus TaxID=1234261 RepID=A0A813XGE3_9BILA|nr:unnamed protein product [Didymodactylos carnosus]CAF3651983.1 unnamed protein product [Didymodactylos carnosus]
MSVEHHVMSLHDSMNTNNVNRVPPTTVNSLKTLSGKEMNQLYETVSILTNDIEVIQNKCVNINEKILKLKNELNESHEQFSKAKQQMNAMNYMRLNQELLQQEINGLKDYVQSTSYNGTYLWKVENVSSLIQDAQSERQLSVYSPPFYSSRNGYKMCMRLYLNGDGNARRTHLSLFFVIMRGKFDEKLLKWPFPYKISFCLFDQSNQQRHIIDSFRPDIKSNSFQQPQTQMNIASGIPKYFPLPLLLDGNSYVKNDSLFIKCIVNFNDMPKMLLPYTLSLNPGLPENVKQSMIIAETDRRQRSSKEITDNTKQN